MIELIRKRDKLKKNVFTRETVCRLQILQRIIQIEIKRKKANYVKEQLQKNTNIPKGLWKALKNLGMPCQVSNKQKVSLRENNLLQFNEKKNANNFKDFSSNLAPDLLN